jgi:hypothetical protein
MKSLEKFRKGQECWTVIHAVHGLNRLQNHVQVYTAKTKETLKLNV